MNDQISSVSKFQTIRNISDYEVSSFHPFLEFYVGKKNFGHKWLAPLFYHIGFLWMPILELKDKLLGAIVLRSYPPPEEALPLAHLTLLVLFSDRWYQGLAFFLIMQVL